MPGLEYRPGSEHIVLIEAGPRIEARVSVHILGGPLTGTELHVRCVVIWTRCHQFAVTWTY